MKIILDTNVIIKDYSLQGGRVLKLSDAAKKLGYEVYIPSIRQWRERGIVQDRYVSACRAVCER